LHVDGAVSEILQYRLENSLIFLLSKVFGKNPIRVMPGSTATIAFDPKAIATGFSGGVDSFATVLQHTSDNCPDPLKLTHLSLFNVGAYGNDEKRTQKIFHEDAQRAQKYADEIKLPLVLLNSNISKAYDVNEITHGYTTRLSISLVSGILSLQKLFKIYLISSSNTIDKVELNKWYQTHYESILSSYLSTNNTNIIIANENLNRVDKTKYIADNTSVHKHLYVCLADHINEKSKIKITKDTFPNCSECFKCLRTLIVIDILGKLNDFRDRFNIQKYEGQRASYIKYLLKHMNRDPYLKEIYDSMVKYKYNFPKEVSFYARIIKYRICFGVFVHKAKRYSYYKLYRPLISIPLRLRNKFSSVGNHKKNKFEITG